MPDKNKHIQQYRSNTQLIYNPIFNIDKTPKFSDWIMTIVFYTAIHVIESEFANINFDSRNHEIREQCMYKNAKLRSVTSQYVVLRNQSRLARYECYKFTKPDIMQALKYLEDIKRVVGVC